MSLIQQALEKTSRAQETRTSTPAPAQRIWDRDPMGAALEQELVRVQESHAARQKLYWKITVALLIVFSVAGFVYLKIQQAPYVIQPKVANVSTPPPAAVPVAIAAPQAPVKIYGGNIYRLTGITDVGGDAIAIINGRLLSEGDALDSQATITKIADGEVFLDVRGRKMKLTL